MRILFLYILKNIKGNIFRTLVIILSIAAASSLLFATNGIADNYTNAYVKMLRSNFGSADIYIKANQQSPSPFLTLDKTKEIETQVDYVIGEMGGYGIYESSQEEPVNVSIKGYDYNDLMQMNPFRLLEQTDLEPFTGNKLIISDKSANKYGFKLNDEITIQIWDKNKTFTIVGIAEQSSIFTTEQQGISAMIPRETMSELNSAPGKVSNIFIKSHNTEDNAQLIKELSEVYPDYAVQETITQKEIDEYYQSIYIIFMFMLVAVLIMSIFLIYTSFKVIIMERIPVIGAFRSIGATKRITNMVLITESVIYGIIGGLIGGVLGIGILYVLGVLMNPYKEFYSAAMDFDSTLLIQALIFGIFVSLISALIPILQTSKFSIKDIVLNNLNYTGKKKYWKLILALLLIMFSIIAPMLIKSNNTNTVLLIGSLAIISILIAMVFLIPYINYIFANLLSFIYSLISSNEGVIAAKNLKNNKNVLNNITLLSIAIATLLMINILSFSIAKETTTAYDIFGFDIMVGVPADNIYDDYLEKITAADGVKEVAGVTSTRNIDFKIDSDTIGTITEIQSIDSSQFSSFINVDFSGSQKGIPQDFDSDRNIMITSQLQSKLKLNEGDTITLHTYSGKKEYTVVAIMDTVMQNGSYAIIPPKYMKSDFRIKENNIFFVKTDDNSDTVMENIKEKLRGRSYFIDTIDNLREENVRSNEQQMKQLTAFSIISLIIGTFGIVNNFILNFIQRKRSFAVLASIGMSKRQSIKILFIEGLSLGIIGGLIGIVTGIGITLIIPYMMAVVVVDIPMHYSSSLIIGTFILAVALTLLSSISPAIRSSKMNIIESIKYE